MGKKLLVADDSLTIQKVIKLALSGEGYEIQSVSDGTEVLAQMSVFRPDAVLIDVALPGRSAFDLKMACNQDPQLSKIPFVLMSGAYEKVDEARVSSLKFEGRLAKPFDPSTLKQSLSQVIRSAPPSARPPGMETPSMGAVPPPPPPPPSALFMKKPDAPTVIEFNDDLWEKEKDPAQTLSQETNPFTVMPSSMPSTPPPAPPSMPKAPPLPSTPQASPTMPMSEADTMTDLSPDTIGSLAPDESPSSNDTFGMNDFTGPSLDFLQPSPKKPPLPPSNPSPSVMTEDSDIKHLTESTVKMSGLDDLEGWNINESAKSPVLPPLPGIFENESSSAMSNSPPPAFDMPQPKSGGDFELTGIGVTGPKTLSADIPDSHLEEIIEKQVRSQIEFLVQQKVKEVLEQMAKDQIPEIAEKVMKQEIRRLLETLGEMS